MKMSDKATFRHLYYERDGRAVAVAHRGANHIAPENTIPAMRKAVEIGADMIEFDLRMTRDRIPVLLHDGTIDRTSDGTGKPEHYIYEELLNFSFNKINGCVQDDTFVPIPKFEDILKEFRDECAMNIQVYADEYEDLKIILDLYKKYDMYDRGFLALSSFEAAERCRSIDPKAKYGILAGWNERSLPESIRKCYAAGAQFAQPIRESIVPETYDAIRETGILANVFEASTKEEMLPLLENGINGILTNRIDILVNTINSFKA